jgi:hypothetical protein
VRTNEGRLAKLKINRSQGDFISFEWVTYARSGEGPSPIPPNVKPCGVEKYNDCGTGKLTGDAIRHFRVLDKKDNELKILVQYSFNSDHGTVWLGARLLDKDGNSLVSGFRPTYASARGEAEVRLERGAGRSRYLFIWLYESYKGEAFICRKFTYRD